MEIPEIPTDNFYKFMSITGLLGTALCFFFPLYYSHLRFVEAHDNMLQLHSQLVDRNTIFRKYAAYGIDPQILQTNDVLISTTGRWDNILQAAKQQFDERIVASTNSLTGDDLAIYLQMIDDFQRLNNRRGEIAMLTDLAIYRTDVEWPRIDIACLLGRFIFPVLSIVGLFLWYYRVQRYQDAALKRNG